MPKRENTVAFIKNVLTMQCAFGIIIKLTFGTVLWPVGQAAKTPASHAGNAGSIPARVTNIKKLFIMKGFFLLLYYPRLRVNSIASLPVICSILISIQDRAFHSRLISFSTAVTSLLYFKPKTFVA